MIELLRRLAVPALVVTALILAACGSDAAAPGQTPPSGPALAGTSTPGVAGTPPASVPDGTYGYDLSNGGFTAEILLAVRGNMLVVSQLNVTNNTGSAVNAVPRVRYLDPQQRTFDAVTEPDWRALYPEGSLGLADGKSAQIRMGFTQTFNPTTVTFCMNLGPQDLGCFAKRGGSTPAATPTP